MLPKFTDAADHRRSVYLCSLRPPNRSSAKADKKKRRRGAKILHDKKEVETAPKESSKAIKNVPSMSQASQSSPQLNLHADHSTANGHPTASSSKLDPELFKKADLALQQAKRTAAMPATNEPAQVSHSAPRKRKLHQIYDEAKEAGPLTYAPLSRQEGCVELTPQKCCRRGSF